MNEHALPPRPERLPLALDSRDIAAVLKVSERTAQRLMRSGRLGPYTECVPVPRDVFWRALPRELPRGRLKSRGKPRRQPPQGGRA